MRKNLRKIFCGILLSAVIGPVSFALVTPGKTDNVDYCTGPNNSNCVFQIDALGNVTTAGSVTQQGTSNALTVNGITVFPPVSVAVTTNTTLSPVSGTYQQLNSSGTVVSLGSPTGSCVIPIIATTTATNGQILIFDSTSTVSYVTFTTTGTTCGISTTSTPPISFQVKPIDFIFDGPQGLWKQIQQ